MKIWICVLMAAIFGPRATGVALLRADDFQPQQRVTVGNGIPAQLALLNADDSRAQLEQAEEQAIKQAAALVAPSLVRIDTVGGLDVVGDVLTSTAPTTGLLLTEDGYIISSAFNFISRPASVLVTLADGRRLAAKTVATDRLRMITLLKVEATNLSVPRATNKSTLQVGQWAIALGRTYDSAQPSISVGIISALNRVWGKAIQTDAKVSPTNYGGPLVDIEGRVMGVLVPLSTEGNSETAGVEWYDSGIGFAVPLEDVYRVLDRLKQGKDLRPGLAGLTFKSRDLFGQAAVIDRVRYDSPAFHAGLKPEDTIVQADGKPVTRLAQLREVLGTKLEGDGLDVAVRRGSETVQTKLTLVGELKPYESAFLGILPDRDTAAKSAGVSVRYVYTDSAASKAGLRPRDRIVELNGTSITSSRQLADLISRLRPADEAKVSFEREGERQTITIKLTAVLDVIPSDLSSPVIPAAEEKPAENQPKTGRFTDQLPGYDQQYWAYVPSDYNPQHAYGLLVWVHPSRDVMEATVYQEWKPLCDQRGLILLAPKAAKISGWNANEAEYIKDLVEHVRKAYTIDPSRIVLHGHANGGIFAAQVAFKYREVFRGLALAGAPLRNAPPDNEPDMRFQFHLICGERDPVLPFVRLTEKSLRAMKYPTTIRTIKDLAAKYPSGDSIAEIAVWIDALDRI